jgi:Ca2+-binding RTX toxin-like protein
VGETITFSYTVTATDGSGVTATDVVSFTITGTNDGSIVQSDKTVWVPSDPARQVPGYENGYDLRISAPIDADTSNVLTITVTDLPAAGQIGYYDGLNFVQLINNQTLTATQLTSLVYIPSSNIEDTSSDTFTYTVFDGSATVQQTVIINEVAPDRLPGLEAQIDDEGHPLNSGSVQETSFGLTSTFAAATNIDPSKGNIVLTTDFQQSPNDDLFNPNELAASRVALRDEVEITLTITESGGGAPVTFAIVMDQNDIPALNFLNNAVGDWIQSTDTVSGVTIDVWSQTIDYDDVKPLSNLSDPTITSLASYLVKNPANVGDTWTVSYLDDGSGNFQARYAKANFFFDDPGDSSISVSPVSGSVQPNLIYGTELDDQLTGGPSNDQIIGRSGTDILAGGGGVDRFIFETISDSPVGDGNRDIILNFDANDVIDLSAVSPALGFSGLNPNVVANSVTYSAVNGNTIIQVDTTGDTNAEMQIQLNGSHTLTSANFLL